MPTDPHTTLTRLGLTECESAMYLTLLAHGAQSVQILARESKVSRTAAYEVLESLVSRGLVTKKTDGSRWVFLAEDPEKLDTYFSQRLDLFSAELATLRRITPELRVQQGVYTPKPRVRFLHGYEGIGQLFDDVEAVAPHELLEFVDADFLATAIDRERVARLRKGVNYHRTQVKFLYSGEKFVPRSTYAEHRRFQGSLPFRGNFWIYANRVVLLNYHQAIEIIIIDHHIFAETMNALFYLAWNAGTPIPITPEV